MSGPIDENIVVIPRKKSAAAKFCTYLVINYVGEGIGNSLGRLLL